MVRERRDQVLAQSGCNFGRPNVGVPKLFAHRILIERATSIGGSDDERAKRPVLRSETRDE
jgi:hypothetical protein